MDNTEISLNNYINDDLSICREERQYALYLRYLASKGNDIPIKASGGNVHLAEEAKFLIRSMMNAKPDLAGGQKKEI